MREKIYKKKHPIVLECPKIFILAILILMKFVACFCLLGRETMDSTAQQPMFWRGELVTCRTQLIHPGQFQFVTNYQLQT